MRRWPLENYGYKGVVPGISNHDSMQLRKNDKSAPQFSDDPFDDMVMLLTCRMRSDVILAQNYVLEQARWV